jgi:lipoprotein-releasing system ATP-binding protein
MTATIHLSAHGLRKTYRRGKTEIPVLHGVDLEIEHGEMVAVVGSSGSGKSTLLHLLGLLDAPDRGLIVLDGERIDNLPERKRVELRHRVFGFIFQFYHLLPELTALENVLLPHMIRHSVLGYHYRRAALTREAAALMERVGLGDRLHHRPAELSGGEMQRAAIARALMGRPAIVLADEPTGNLDPSTGQGVWNLLRDLNREREVSMIVVTHDHELARRADRVIRLDAGRIQEWRHAAAI